MGNRNGGRLTTSGKDMLTKEVASQLDQIDLIYTEQQNTYCRWDWKVKLCSHYDHQDTENLERYNEHPALILISELLGNILTSQEEDESIPEENMLTDSDEENHDGDDDSEP